MSTVTDLIVAAFGRSARNQATDLATRSTELLAVVRRSFAAYYSLAARINPEYVGATLTIPLVAGAYLRPATVEIVWKIQTQAGAVVAVIPPDDLTMEPGVPAVYRLGRAYYPAGRANDPTPPLTFYCAIRAPVLTAVTDALPLSWDEQFNDLVILDLAQYLALKDARPDELPALAAEHAAWVTLFTNFLRHETTAMRRRWGQPGTPTIATAGV